MHSAKVTAFAAFCLLGITAAAPLPALSKHDQGLLTRSHLDNLQNPPQQIQSTPLVRRAGWGWPWGGSSKSASTITPKPVSEQRTGSRPMHAGLFNGRVRGILSPTGKGELLKEEKARQQEEEEERRQEILQQREKEKAANNQAADTPPGQIPKQAVDKERTAPLPPPHQQNADGPGYSPPAQIVHDQQYNSPARTYEHQPAGKQILRYTSGGLNF